MNIVGNYTTNITNTLDINMMYIECKHAKVMSVVGIRAIERFSKQETGSGVIFHSAKRDEERRRKTACERRIGDSEKSFSLLLSMIMDHFHTLVIYYKPK